jgi:hypothetical protein
VRGCWGSLQSMLSYPDYEDFPDVLICLALLLCLLARLAWQQSHPILFVFLLWQFHYTLFQKVAQPASITE